MKLKPCPFCGDKGEIECVVHYPGCEDIDHYYVQCVNCEARMEELLFQEEAEKAWNHRPLENQLKAHAVEVLAKVIYKYERSEIDSAEFESHEKWYQNQYRAEARTLLGWDNEKENHGN